MIEKLRRHLSADRINCAELGEALSRRDRDGAYLAIGPVLIFIERPRRTPNLLDRLTWARP